MAIHKARTATPLRSGVVIPLGAHPGNTGGKKERSGRKPDAWKERLQQIVSSDAVLDELELVLRASRHPAYVGVLKYATEHGYGKPKESLELTGKDSGPVEFRQTWRFGKREIAF
jgi:hypothetical protein